MAINFINNIIAQLGSGNKSAVHVSVTPRLGIEMILIDRETNTVKKYGYKPLEYNEALREIKDYNEFKTALTDLFDELKIDPKTSVILSIPTVHIGKIELPLILSDDMIQEAIISEVEQSYIFKRCEPIVSWVELVGDSNSETRTILYSAIQKPVIDSIKESLTSIGSSLEKLEISLTSDLRALSYTGLTQSQMTEGTPWTLMVIKSNGYELVQMNGQKICDFYTEPLALKTYEMEEIYDAIYASVQIALLNFPTNNLVIISETDIVSAEHMAAKIQIDGNITYIENNDLKKQDYLPVSLEILPDIAAKVSLGAIGVATIYIHTLESEFEFTGNKQNSSTTAQPIYVNWQGKEYELTEPIMIRILLIIGAVLIIPSLLALLIFSSVSKNAQKNLDDVNGKIKVIEGQITELNGKTDDGDFDVTKEIENVIKTNRTKLIAYSALGESVPKKLWIKYYSTREDGKIDIIGVSENVEDIYIFFRNLKDSIIDSQLRLNKLEMQTNSVEDAVLSSSNYEFEITNLSEEDLKAKTEGDSASKNSDSKSDSKGDNNNSPSDSNKKNVKDLEEVEVH